MSPQKFPQLLRLTEERMGVAEHLIMIAVIANYAPTAVSQQAKEPVATVFQRLQSSTDINEATEELLKRGRSDSEVREYIARHLPPMIEKGPAEKDHPGNWIELVRIAGELKIAEAAPALTKWLTIDNIGEISTGGFIRLENNPAGKALAEIGDPAVPAVARIFDQGTLPERRYAVYVLSLINTSSAKSALQEQSKSLGTTSGRPWAAADVVALARDQLGRLPR